MTARPYAEWARLSGLYVANVSHFDRYQTYARQLSPAGLTVIIASDFFEDANPALDVDDWRTHQVYEFGDQAIQRVALTSAALREIGAEGLAARVASAKNYSPFAAIQGFLAGETDFAAVAENVNPMEMLQSLRTSLSRALGDPKLDPSSASSTEAAAEQRAQVEQLLDEYAERHAAELQSDIDRHGDPRLKPGYTLKGRLKELDQLRSRWFAHQEQADAIESLTKVMVKLPKLVAQNTPGKEKKAAQHLKQLVRLFREKTRELRKTPPQDLSDATQAFLPRLEAFETEHASLLRKDRLGSESLRQQAESIGPFESDSDGRSSKFSWDAPTSLRCDWAQFSLTLSVPAKSKTVNQRGLRAVERLKEQFAQVAEGWRQQILDSFRNHYFVQLSEDELSEYETDDNGEPTDRSILEHVEGGEIAISANDPEANSFEVSAFVAVDWDPEHGLELTCDIDLGDELPGSHGFDPGGVTFQSTGPTVSDDDLNRFEQTFGVTLPAAYREFIKHTNGGIPSRRQLTLSMYGSDDSWEVTRFYSLSGAAAEPFLAGSLEEAVGRGGGASLRFHLLPVASVRQGTFPPRPLTDVQLAIVLQGKRAGRIVLFEGGSNPPMDEMPLADGPVFGAMLDEAIRSAPVAAPHLSALFAQLKQAQPVAIPNWMGYIRKNQIDDFLGWLEAGGKLKEKFVDRDTQLRPTVADVLAAEASPELLELLIQKKKLTPDRLRESWRQYLVTDAERFGELMRVLPQSEWHFAFCSPNVWDHPAILEQLAAEKVDVNLPIDDVGGTPLHHAAQLGRSDAVSWLLDRGADASKTNHYREDALAIARRTPGSRCLELLEARCRPVPAGTASPDAEGIEKLAQAAKSLPPGCTLRLQIDMKSPAVLALEKAYYGSEGCHYRLTFDVGDGKVTFNDTRSPRQDYLHGRNWTEALFLPILQWPELTPLWETLQVCEFELSKALKKRNYEPTPRPDLLPAARSALEQAFEPQEAAARGLLPRH